MSQGRVPIAVVGISCRLPGAEDANEFWRLLLQERDVIGPLPTDRWVAEHIHDLRPSTPGRTYAPYGGFIPDGDRFDRELFEVSEYESERMDPQQGMALELAWHGLEDAGIAPTAVRGRDVGVYLGVSTRDFDRRSSSDWETVDVRTALGACASVIANRVSYSLALCGPSITVDVGCASSLVSIHVACQALHFGECELALAGGVQLIMSPANIIAFAQGKLLANDGRCKSFSTHADGYVCGEGGGIVVLKRLDEALRDRDRIYAVIKGSATNHNGASNGLSAPLGTAQRKLVRAALSAAGISPGDVGYVETHSIGTRIGDAIEVNALKAVLSPGRTEAICYLGSAKPNFGHLEAAAGIVSFMKAALAVYHGVIPKTLYSEPLSSDLKLDGTSFRVASQVTAWTNTGIKRVAGVSALSFGGANAHIVIDQAVPQAGYSEHVPVSCAPCILVLSGGSVEGLQALAGRYIDYFAEAPQWELADICATAARGRSHLRYRVATVIYSKEQAVRTLTRFLRGEHDEQLLFAPRSGVRKSSLRWTLTSTNPADESQGNMRRVAAEAVRQFAQRLWSRGAIPHRIECNGVKIPLSQVATEWPWEAVLNAMSLAPSEWGVRFAVSAADASESKVVVLDSDEECVHRAVALSYVAGAHISWDSIYAYRSRCSIPVYPMQRKRHWKLSDYGASSVAAIPVKTNL